MKTRPLAGGVLLGIVLAAGTAGAANPANWIPARWDGGPLEVARRGSDKSLADPGVREAVADWYNPATLDLLQGTPVNCVLVSFAGGGDRTLERKQQQLVTDYARKARARGIAVLGLVNTGAEASATAQAALGAQLDGLVLDGKFPDADAFASQVEKALRSSNSRVLVIPIAASDGAVRNSSAPILAVEGLSPGIGTLDDSAVAAATGRVWLDSNMWRVRSLRLTAEPPAVWISSRPRAGGPGAYLKSIADAAAVGGRWIITLEDELRAKLLRQDAQALDVWRGMGTLTAFFVAHSDWLKLAPFGTIGIVFDTAGKNLSNSEEFLNLVARRQIPYRVIERARFGAGSLAGLRAVLAFDLAPPSDAERKMLRDFAAQGGLVLAGPSWGKPPRDQSYTMDSVEQGEVAIYKDEAPDPASVARDLNDMVDTADLGVTVVNAPSVLPYVTANESGDRMVMQLVNYTDAPVESLVIWLQRKINSARLLVPNGPVTDLPIKRSGARTEITIPKLGTYGAVIVE